MEEEKTNDNIRHLLLKEINHVLCNSVQLDHNIMELEARREALRVETLKMNELLQQPSSLHYLHPKHHVKKKDNNNNTNNNTEHVNNNKMNNRQEGGKKKSSPTTKTTMTTTTTTTTTKTMNTNNYNDGTK